MYIIKRSLVSTANDNLNKSIQNDWNMASYTNIVLQQTNIQIIKKYRK